MKQMTGVRGRQAGDESMPTATVRRKPMGWGTGAKGSAGRTATLSEAQVHALKLEVATLRAQGAPVPRQRDLAAKHRMSPGQVSRILQGASWSHVKVEVGNG